VPETAELIQRLIATLHSLHRTPPDHHEEIK